MSELQSSNMGIVRRRYRLPVPTIAISWQVRASEAPPYRKFHKCPQLAQSIGLAPDNTQRLGFLPQATGEIREIAAVAAVGDGCDRQR